MKIMAVDYGDARTGLAACDRTEFLASPLGVIHEYNFDRCVQQVAYAVEEYQIGKVVVGHPKNMDGSEGDR
ncbi:MAG: Holliday junction resolvase RuvX, partial [Oscillospiraceae bacterium]|nr:Holliday junction resolvase RuvX [Oscillospiraceae bacterium]